MRRALRRTIRTVAAGLGLMGLISLGLDFAKYRLRGTAPGVWSVLGGAVLVILGIVVFAISASLAEQWADDDLDE
ncbi:MAG: hypothetical protein U1F98_01395 [Verrucomicrobiota bacterium]